MPKATIRDYEPDDGDELVLIVDISMIKDYRAGLFKAEKHTGYYLVKHSYWLVSETQTNRLVPVLVNLRKQQFKKADEEFAPGERVIITGGYIKRYFDNESAIQILDAADSLNNMVTEKNTSRLLRFFGATSPNNPALHPFGVGLKRKGNQQKLPVLGTMFVASKIERVESAT